MHEGLLRSPSACAQFCASSSSVSTWASAAIIGRPLGCDAPPSSSWAASRAFTSGARLIEEARGSVGKRENAGHAASSPPTAPKVSTGVPKKEMSPTRTRDWGRDQAWSRRAAGPSFFFDGAAPNDESDKRPSSSSPPASLDKAAARVGGRGGEAETLGSSDDRGGGKGESGVHGPTAIGRAGLQGGLQGASSSSSRGVGRGEAGLRGIDSSRAAVWHGERGVQGATDVRMGGRSGLGGVRGPPPSPPDTLSHKGGASKGLQSKGGPTGVPHYKASAPEPIRHKLPAPAYRETEEEKQTFEDACNLIAW